MNTNQFIKVNLFPKQDFLDLGFKFEPVDENDEYYGMMILDSIKFRWFDPCFSSDMWFDTSQWAYGFVNSQKVDFSHLYFLNSVNEIKENLLRILND